MPTERTFLPVSFCAPAHVVGPPPVVEKPATRSGLAWMMEVATAMAWVGSGPSSWTSRMVRSGQYFFMLSAKTLATMSSVALWLFWVMATEPLVTPCFLSSSHMALATGSGYLEGSAAIWTALSA